MNKRAIFVLTALWITALTGCGQEEVVYGEDTGSKEQEEIQENQASGTLRDLLQIGDEKIWEETIEGKDGTIRVNAEIRVPDVANLYTMMATRYYLTKEDKKRIAEYFLDADTIKVNRDAMKNDDIKEEPEDYSENYYIGNKGDARYSICFYEDSYADAPANICSWLVYRDEDFNPEDQTDEPNDDKMTEEKAISQAVKICAELGLSNMSVVSVTSFDVSEDGTGDIKYHLDLARYINGVAVDSNEYYTSKSYSESGITVTPYPQESVVMEFGDFGLVNMGYYGSIKVGEVGNAVKLLSYSQIQEVLRRELEKTEAVNEYAWTLLELSYQRVEDGSEPDVFCFLPVWRLGKNNEGMSSWTEDNIFINAIDGSRIYPEEVGVAQFFGDM